MGKTTLSPFDGSPRATVQLDDKDKIVSATITVRALSPLRKFLADKLRWLTGIYCAVETTGFLWDHPPAETWAWLLPIPAFAVGTVVGHYVWGEVLKWKKVFRLTRETFECRNWWGTWNEYDRRQQHGFILREHRLGQAEARWIDFFKGWACLRGLPRLARPYCGESQYLCFEFGHRPIRLMSIYGKLTADTVLGRFVAIDRALDGAMSRSGGMRFEPKDEWDRGVGGLQQGF
jgi:hypothetical protein